MIDDFAHRLRIDQIRDGDRLELSANVEERAAIARRLGLQSIDRLDAHVALARSGGAIRANGRLTASFDQSCVVTGDPVAAHVDEPFAIQFVAEPKDGGPDDEIELGEADCDTVFYEAAMIDLGEALADTLALSLDPYPRSAGADAALKEAGIMSEEEASPFAVLAKLRKSDET